MKKIRVPGSKSISNRVLLLAALSDKPVILENLLESDDTVYMRESLEKFGVKFENLAGGAIKVLPSVDSVSFLDVPNKREGFEETELFIGNAGTAARFLSCVSLLLGDSESFVLDGIERMTERPQEDLFRGLRQVGVTVDCLKNEGFLPAKFSKSAIEKNNNIKISGKVSSQFISGLLLVAPRTGKGLTIEVLDDIPSWPYIQMTLDILKIWGVGVEVTEDRKVFKVFPGISAPSKYAIPSDMSSASYPVAWSILKKEKICIENFGSKTLQGDEGFLKVAEKVGAKVSRDGDKCFIDPPENIQPIGDFDWSEMPDVSMTGMVLAAAADGESCFTGLESLRVKECDRIVAMEQLKNFGVKFEIDGDNVKIIGSLNLGNQNFQQSRLAPQNTELRHVVAKNSNSLNFKIDSFDDHRIAMCFGILRMYLGLGVDFHNDSCFMISEPNCVAKTWPNFWLDFAKIEEQLRLVSAIIVERDDKYLIVKKPRKDFAWQFPQGGVDEGETYLQAAKRELREECGTNLSVKFKGEKSLGFYDYTFPKNSIHFKKGIIGAHIAIFRAEYLEGIVEVDNDEIIDHAWVKYDKFQDFFEASYWKNVEKFL